VEVWRVEPKPAILADMSVPVLDLSAAGFRDKLRQVTHEVGFFYLTGHDVDPALVARLFTAARAFFALPRQAKLEIENVRSPHFRGYTRLGGELTEGRPDWREQVDVGPEQQSVAADPDAPWLILRGPNQWPAQLPEFRRAVLDWYTVLTAVSRRLLREWALSLGQSGDVFDTAFQDAASLIKVIRYPGRDAGAGSQGVGGHKDVGALTLLLVEPGRTGLQVERDDTWVDVPPVEGTLVVNIGELLEVATDGYLRATRHRVISPPAGQDRISVPFFFNPDLSQTIPRLALPAELAAAARGVSSDKANVLHARYGVNALKSRLRAHPDVARAHHPHLVSATTGSGSAY
jgi:isopenicillin N synthase-like dioxygenase